MSKPICIMGKGRSHIAVKDIADEFDEILLCNMDAHFINRVKQDPELVEILKEKECTLFCNTSKSGFIPQAFNTFNVKKCVVNRVKPTKDWELWKIHKATQTRGLWYHNEEIPAVERDLPYFFKWRGPAKGYVQEKNVNYPIMQLSNGFDIQHLSDDVEMYLFEPTRDRIETNMGLYYTALYSIIDLKKDHLFYCGVDFYDKINDSDSWQKASVARLQMEGAHMKILVSDYLARYFPNVTFEFHTSANLQIEKDNVKINRKEI